MSAGEELTEVRQAHRFDEAALLAYLQRSLPEMSSELRVRQFEGGQSNPTFLLTSGGKSWVLRKKPPGKLLPTAHMIEREHRVLSALSGSDVPVPRVLLLCEDASVIGTPFFVMQYVEGRIFADPRLPGIEPAERRAVYGEMARVLAALHRVDPMALGLGDYGKPGNYFARQIDRWSRQYEAARTDELASLDRLIAWLPQNIPAGDDVALVHGDFRMQNLIFHPSEPTIVAVLDWELSTLGHPLSDLAYHCMPYHVAGPGHPGLDAGETPGLPSEHEHVAEYCRHAGRSVIAGWGFYMAFSLFRSAAIIQGVYKRGLDGNASSARALELGALVRVLGDTGWRVAQRGE
jgi:aminoglycoside phosphotransferase (APT) family kinase protein